MKNDRRILIIAAHPDDDILGCGGILSKYNGTNITFKVIFIAEGSSCRYYKNSLGNKKIDDEIANRNEFGSKALEYLGVKNYNFYNLPCGRLDSIPIIEINQIIEKEIKEFSPNTILTHDENDTNNDHRIIFRSTLMATRPLRKNKVNTVYSYEVLSTTEWNFGNNTFKPNHFIELNKNNIIEKIKALNFYISEIGEFPFPRSEEGLWTLSKYRGMQTGVNYAEAFKLIRRLEL